MNLSTIPVRPYAEGIIRIATTSEPGAEKVVFDGSIEILARHHQAREADVIAVPRVPRLAKHPMRDKLMEEKPNKDAGKLVEVPIRMFFGKTSNVIRTSNLVNPGCYAGGRRKLVGLLRSCLESMGVIERARRFLQGRHNELVKSMNRMEARLVTK